MNSFGFHIKFWWLCWIGPELCTGEVVVPPKWFPNWNWFAVKRTPRKTGTKFSFFFWIFMFAVRWTMKSYWIKTLIWTQPAVSRRLNKFQIFYDFVTPYGSFLISFIVTNLNLIDHSTHFVQGLNSTIIHFYIISEKSSANNHTITKMLFAVACK